MGPCRSQDFAKLENRGPKKFYFLGYDLNVKDKTQEIKDDLKIWKVIKWIKKFCGLSANDTLNIYVNDSFIPKPDESLFDLHDKFCTSDGTLTIKYAKKALYG